MFFVRTSYHKDIDHVNNLIYLTKMNEIRMR